MTKTNFKTIDEYINTFPKEVRKKLEEIRRAIKETVPEAEEAISYQIPTFKLNGNLVHFAAFKNHIGFYPAPSGSKKFAEELSVYKTGKGSVQFPFDKPLPLDLITRIVEFRVKETAAKIQKKSRKK